MRRQVSLQSLCRPPSLRRSCRIRVPADIVKDPDPSTFDVESAFASGSNPSFNSPDISTIHLWPIKPIDAIEAIVTNLSADAAAHRTHVDVSWSECGIGLERTPIFLAALGNGNAKLGGPILSGSLGGERARNRDADY